MTEHPPLSSRAAHARALADALLTEHGAGIAIDEVVQRALAATIADAAQLSMMTDQLVSVCPSGLLGGVVEPGSSLPFEETLCAQVLRVDDAVVIPDASADQRVAGVPAVASGAWSAYLGAPVRTQEGHLVAVLCVFHRTAREWTVTEQEAVRELAEQAGRILDDSVRVPVGGR